MKKQPKWKWDEKTSQWIPVKKKHLKKTTAVAVIFLTMFAFTVGATILTYYGQINTTANVSQSVLLGDEFGWYAYDEPVYKVFDVTGGCFKCTCMKIKNDGCIEAGVDVETVGEPDLDGIIVSGWEIPQDYEFHATSITYDDYGKPNGLDVDITVTVDECWVTWTFDFPVDSDPGNGNMGYGLVIGTPGSLPHPLFQIHNNDGTDPSYDWGTHLYSPWGPEGTGWNGWHTGDTNTPVDELDWVQCTGERQHDDNPDGVFTVSIKLCELFKYGLADNLIWTAHFGAGGFFDYGGLSKYPEEWTPWSGDITDGEWSWLADCFYDSIMQQSPALILQPGETKYFCWCYDFDIAIMPGTYSITSYFNTIPSQTP